MLNEVLERLAIYGYTVMSHSADKTWYNTFNLESCTSCTVEQNQHGDVYLQFKFSTPTLQVSGNTIGAYHCIKDTSVFHFSMKTIEDTKKLFH